MRKTLLNLLAVTVGILAGTLEGNTCTNVIVSRGASRDGSVLVSYAADSHYLFGELYYKPAADWKAGSLLKVYEWDTNRYLGEIEQVYHTYQTVGNMNEHQLIITALIHKIMFFFILLRLFAKLHFSAYIIRKTG